MTVLIEKPELSLRGELASLRNRGTYQEQQFYFDNLVINGTFDTDTTGWTATNSAALSIVSEKLRVTNGAASFGTAQQSITTEIGKSYLVGYSGYTGGTSFEFRLGTSAGNYDIARISNPGSGSVSFTATTTSTHITLQNYTGTLGNYAEWDNISAYETDGTDIIHTMPQGWKPKDVFEDGLLQREGSAHDYEVVYDGFDYVVKPTVAPSATTQTCVIGVKA